MPRRKVKLVTGKVYHLVNRGVDRRKLFMDKLDYRRGVESLDFYQYQDLECKFSRLSSLSKKGKEKVLLGLKDKLKLVEILAYCLMTNHVHLVLRQLVDGGTTEFARNYFSSFAHYFNIRHKRKGSLYEGRFKVVLVKTNEQLLHLSRYAHLNPYTSRMVNTIDELIDYPWSSLKEYVVGGGICNQAVVLDSFEGRGDYLRFVSNQADYQRKLGDIKKIVLE